MKSSESTKITLISPSSGEGDTNWEPKLRAFSSAGLSVSYHKLEPDPSWAFCASSAQQRLDQLLAALYDESSDFVWAVRGGYGASDLIDHIPWTSLRKLKPKVIVGFSDISALHSAFFTKLGWLGLHGPMPATSYWQDPHSPDIDHTIKILRGQRMDTQLPLLYLGRGFEPTVKGWAFGGCLSVLTNLIGTPYFPGSLEGALLYWEDIGEHPARILRFVNQWSQSGCLQGVRGIVLGRFVDCWKEGQSTEASLYEAIAARLSIPVWHSPSFGHCSPNWPLPIGMTLRIDSGTLSWKWITNHVESN